MSYLMSDRKQLRMVWVAVAVCLVVTLGAYLAIRIPEAGKGCSLFHYRRSMLSVWKVEKSKPWPGIYPDGLWTVSVKDGEYMLTISSHESLDCALLQAALGGVRSDRPWW